MGGEEKRSRQKWSGAHKSGYGEEEERRAVPLLFQEVRTLFCGSKEATERFKYKSDPGLYRHSWRKVRGELTVMGQVGDEGLE